MIGKVKSMGQYFTPEIIADFMTGLVEHGKNAQVFEPCAGKGVFLKSLSKQKFRNIIAYEIDPTLENKSSIRIENKNTLFDIPKQKFDVIIGNPPYVRWKNIPKDIQLKLKTNPYWKNIINGLNDLLYPFILLSIDLLKEDGELIFITPKFWTSTLHSKIVREKMLKHGEITHFINFEEMKIFEGVSSNILIFRFVKSKKNRKCKVIRVKKNGKINLNVISHISNMLKEPENKKELLNEYDAYLHEQFNSTEPWNPIPPSVKPIINKIEKNADSKLGDIAEICNGMVSGLDKAFKVVDIRNFSSDEKKHFIKVAKARDISKYIPKTHTFYIYLNDLKLNEQSLSKSPCIYKQLKMFKTELEKRYSYQIDIPWWEWVFLRNKRHIEKSQEKIVVPCKERFNSRKYVRFALLRGKFYITQDMTCIIKNPEVEEDIKYLLALLNSDLIFKWLKYRGLRRGGVLEFSEEPLSKIPIKRINWEDEDETKLYQKIIDLVEKIILLGEWTQHHPQINELVEKLYGFK